MGRPGMLKLSRRQVASGRVPSKVSMTVVVTAARTGLAVTRTARATSMVSAGKRGARRPGVHGREKPDIGRRKTCGFGRMDTTPPWCRDPAGTPASSGANRSPRRALEDTSIFRLRDLERCRGDRLVPARLDG